MRLLLPRFLAIHVALLVAVTFSAPTVAQTADHAAIVSYLADDVDNIAFLDLTKIDAIAAMEEIVKLGALRESDVAHARQAAKDFQETIAQCTARGVWRVYVLVRPSDISAGGATWALEMADDSEPNAFVEQLNPLIATVQDPKGFGDLGDVVPKKLEVVGNMILGGPSAERLAAIKTAAMKKSPPRPEALAALAALDGADAGVVVFGSADSRRVVREMWPPAPAPFAELTGPFLVDGLKRIVLTAKLPPAPTATLAVEATTPEAAATLHQAAQKLLTLAKTVALKNLLSADPTHRMRAIALSAALPLVEPKLEGTRLSVAITSDQKTLDAFRQVVLPAVDSARSAAFRSQQMNNFKQLLLGMLNYESANKTLPAAASRDADGKPLLSWRVLILPYIEQKALYDQFHLDEPWDSEHNIKLVEQMPTVYANPNLPATGATAGRTTVLVPRGDKTMFPGDKGLTFRAVTDGTSNTISLVNAAPERAVVWTKPEDWEVDFKHPLRGVKSADGEGFIVGFVDGSVHFIANDVDPANFAAQLTANGGEVTTR